MKTVQEVADSVVDHDLIGYNIHYHPETGEWNVWSRRRTSDGWTISGRHTDLSQALSGVIVYLDDDDDDLGDLV